MTLLPLLRPALPLVIACLLALPARALVADHPDEVAATLTWLDDARRQAARVPPDPLPPAATATEAEAPPTASLQDPFGLHQPDAMPPDASASQRPRPRSGDTEPGAADAADAADAAPPRPALRMLGSLRQDDLQQALVEIAGTTYRVGRGDTLPAGLGKVVAVSDDAIDISDGATTRTITIDPTPVSAPAPAPSSLPSRQGKRRLTRPGARA
ncbi:pilus assembly protein PilP [Herbaspirillum sp. NPDC087042]|uniref:pilus assembly protein PilP n=1 Tax=Herbaspirillum sp. NPDC087042 TaxID=3364004 RepID=UPI00381E7D73